MANPNTPTFRNQLLSRLTRADLDLVVPALTQISLPVRKPLQKPGAVINDLYFVEDGIVSVVASGSKKSKRVEAGLIGREGVTGIEVILAGDRSQHEVYMQVGGSGFRMRVEDAIKAMATSERFRQLLLRFASAFLMQVSETALANGSATIDARLSRWLLMAQDRLNNASLPLTHEFLALMLGVRRAGVTIAIQELARDALIDSKRAHVTILDRAGLIARAGGIYGRSESELRRLIG